MMMGVKGSDVNVSWDSWDAFLEKKIHQLPSSQLSGVKSEFNKLAFKKPSKKCTDRSVGLKKKTPHVKRGTSYFCVLKKMVHQCR